MSLATYGKQSLFFFCGNPLREDRRHHCAIAARASRMAIGCQLQNAIVSKHWLVAVTLLGMFQVQSPHSSNWSIIPPKSPPLVCLCLAHPALLLSCLGQKVKGWGPQLVMNAMILLRSKLTLSPSFPPLPSSHSLLLACTLRATSVGLGRRRPQRQLSFASLPKRVAKPKFFKTELRDYLTHLLVHSSFPFCLSPAGLYCETFYYCNPRILVVSSTRRAQSCDKLWGWRQYHSLV